MRFGLLGHPQSIAVLLKTFCQTTTGIQIFFLRPGRDFSKLKCFYNINCTYYSISNVILFQFNGLD